MMLDTSKNILIVGLGLIGGSYAKALRKLGFKISAITLDREDIDYALKNGIIDFGCTEPDPKVIGRAELIIFALYPHVFVEWIDKYQSYLKPGALLTDVTGVKGAIVEKIQAMLRPDVEFIAAHPMAGREVYGVKNSDERIFHGANYIVTPTSRNTDAAVEDCLELRRLLGFSHVSVLTPEKHDEMIGFVSQLTHCIAVSLMCTNDTPGFEAYTGDSFRDLTRIAKINGEMWSELFISNKQFLLNEMDNFINQFTLLRDMLENEDKEGMCRMMQISTQRREIFDKPKVKEG